MRPATTRPKTAVTADGQGVASHAWSRLLADLADRTGVTTVLSDPPAPTRQRSS